MSKFTGFTSAIMKLSIHLILYGI